MQTNFTEPTKHASGLFLVDWGENFVHWLAWREWLHLAFNKCFFPKKMTCLFALPPTSSGGAIAVAEWLQNFREQLTKEGGSRTGTLAAVTLAVAPWCEWSSALKQDAATCELLRRKVWGDDFFEHAPRYHWTPRMGFRWNPPVERAARPPRMHPLRRTAA